ncbi:MAG: acyl-ACP--UDP-N-acetylglucosamine O-acyltransferase [Thermodesulfobacteriota bacterium]
MNIHPTAIVDPKAELASGVKVGPHAVINAHAVIGEGTEIMAGAYIDSFATIGRDCRIFPMASVGTVPQDLKFKGERSELVIGDRVTIREFATLNRGTEGGGGRTTVGEDCLLMAYTHVAHDCHIGHRVIISNNLVMAGHVTIEDDAIVSGLVAIHQFTRLGTHCYIGGYSRVSKDVPPYMLGEGAVEFQLHGPNTVGLKRKGFSEQTIRALKDAYRLIFRNRRPLQEVLDETLASLGHVPEVVRLVEFIRSSERGVCR